MIYEHMGMKKTAMEWLNYWIAEREEIRLRKERFRDPPNLVGKYPKPYSADPIFQTTYFCNVRREDDKVTRWIRQNWTPQWFRERYDYSIVLARMINNIPCLDHLRYYNIANFEEVQEQLELRARQGQQVWGGAYVVTSHGLPMPKAAYLCQRVLPAAYNKLVVPGNWPYRYPSSAPTLARAHELLMQLEGLGSFMAAQVIADLKNTEGHPLQKAEDWADFSAPGPGSIRGLKWLDPQFRPGQYKVFMDALANNLDHENRVVLAGGGYVVNMQDLQNCLCEFDKFMRVMTKTGKSKRKYDGR